MFRFLQFNAMKTKKRLWNTMNLYKYMNRTSQNPTITAMKKIEKKKKSKNLTNLDSLHMKSRGDDPAVLNPLGSLQPHQTLTEQLPRHRIEPRLLKISTGIHQHRPSQRWIADGQPRPGSEPEDEDPSVRRRPGVVVWRNPGDDVMVKGWEGEDYAVVIRASMLLALPERGRRGGPGRVVLEPVNCSYRRHLL